MLPLHQRRVFQAEAAGLEPANACCVNCFQDSILIQPDDFRLLSCGSWNRTNGLLRPPLRGGARSQASLPAATAPDHICISDTRHLPWFAIKFGEQDLNLHHRVQSPAACR